MPHYPPEDVRALAQDTSARRLTRSALDGCVALGIDPEVAWETVAGVDSNDCKFIKTLASVRREGEMLDVYDALVEGQQVYVKLKIIKTDAQPSKLLVVLSFKRNEFYERTLR